MTQTTIIVNRNLWGNIVSTTEVQAAPMAKTQSFKPSPEDKFFKGRTVPVFEEEADDLLGKEDFKLYDENGNVIEYKSHAKEWSSPGLEAGIDLKAHKLLAKQLAGTALEGMLIDPDTTIKEERVKLRDFYDAYTLAYVDNSVQHDLKEIPLSDQVRENYARLVYETKKVMRRVKTAMPKKDIEILVASDWTRYEEACEWAKAQRTVIDQNRGLGAGMSRRKARMIYLSQPLADKHQMKQLCDFFKELVENAILPEMEYLVYSSSYNKVEEHDITSPDFKWSRQSLGRIGKAASRIWMTETNRMCRYQNGIIEDFDTLISTNREFITSEFSDEELSRILKNAGLTKGEALVMKARYVSGYSVKETCEFIGKSTKGYEMAHGRAISKLRKGGYQALSAKVKRCSDKKLDNYVDRLVEAIFGDDPSPNATPTPKAKKTGKAIAKKGELHKYTANGREYSYDPRPGVTEATPVTSRVENKAELDAYWTSRSVTPGYVTKKPSDWNDQDYAEYEASILEEATEVSTETPMPQEENKKRAPWLEQLSDIFPVTEEISIDKQKINYAYRPPMVKVERKDVASGGRAISELPEEFTYEPSPVFQPKKRSYFCNNLKDVVRSCDCCES